MKVAIVVFSPSGNTLKVATILSQQLAGRGIGVQLVDVTKNELIFKSGGLQRFLEKTIQEHDLLCIGGPVYAHHLHYNVKSIIQALPKPGGKWGKLAVPFVTYGTISSGISLHETAVLFQKSGRTTVCGMKIEAFHYMSRLLSIKVGQGLPGEKSLPVIAELADRILRLTEINQDQVGDMSRFLNYQSVISKIKAQFVFREKIWHRHMYPKLALDREKCKFCGKCIKVCPVQRLEIVGGILAIEQKPECIHCGECINVCPSKAICFQCDLEKWNRLFVEAAKGNGPLPSHEKPKSAVYPMNFGL
jgi:ferredoxin/flavodoxin